MSQNPNSARIGMNIWMNRHPMNQMNPMNPFGGWWYIKKKFLMYGVVLRVFMGSSRYIGHVFGIFILIIINILINISSLDVPNVHG